MMRPSGILRRTSGLTLMEVLVAISLLSLLSVGILTALRVGATAWARTNENLMLDRRIASANTILNAALENMLPAVGEFVRPEYSGPSNFVFFQGHPDAMRFVTSYSLERGPRAGMRLFELQVIQGPKGKRLLLNDLSWDGPRSAIPLITGAVEETPEMRLLFVPIQAQPTSFIIADELENCSFSYLQQEGGPEEPGRWLPVWPRISQLPMAVSIQIAGRGDSPRLQPVSITAPVRSRLRP